MCTLLFVLSTCDTLCWSVGRGESSASSAEGWASVSHGPGALSGLSSCLVIGYLPDNVTETR